MRPAYLKLRFRILSMVQQEALCAPKFSVGGACDGKPESQHTQATRSKVRVSPALCTLGPRLPLPHQVGAYIGGGGLQHVRHIITWMAAQQGNYLFPYWATA